MRKLKAVEVLKAISECAALPVQKQVEYFAKKLNISESHAYYLIRNRAADAAMQPVTAAVENTAVENSAAIQQPPVAEQKSIHVLRTEFDTSAFIPPNDPQYKMREVDADIERYSERRDFATVLIGEAGTGKTYAIQQYAARKKLPFLRVACDDSLILRELLGRREIRQGQTFFKFGLLLEFLQIPCVILFDEFNGMPSGKLLTMHEILDKMSDGHRVFVKEADTVITINKDCHIFLACNPSNAKYTGTNKMNAAFADRPRIINFQPFTVSEVKEFFDCGNEAITNSLKQYFTEARKLIQTSGMRAVFSLRSIKRITSSIKQGDAIGKALEHNFYNMTLLTASETEREQLYNLAKVCFGLETMKAGQK